MLCWATQTSQGGPVWFSAAPLWSPHAHALFYPRLFLLSLSLSLYPSRVPACCEPRAGRTSWPRMCPCTGLYRNLCLVTGSAFLLQFSSDNFRESARSASIILRFGGFGCFIACVFVLLLGHSLPKWCLSKCCFLKGFSQTILGEYVLFRYYLAVRQFGCFIAFFCDIFWSFSPNIVFVKVLLFLRVFFRQFSGEYALFRYYFANGVYTITITYSSFRGGNAAQIFHSCFSLTSADVPL